ncbi:class I SAM-dependent RNA methyltransferase [Hoyosella sp. YIM 151337]|uniref:class I SAM-dependent RNA methyltransferase n=1 Tax=Hoyosella sp. YIM 151337 TaxID=2992742 RepID=UPI0035A893D4
MVASTVNWTGDVLSVDLGEAAHGGVCVARHEGRVVFVRYGIPGERVRALVTEDNGGAFCFAEAIDIIDPAPGRSDSLCPVSGPGGAGCCDFAHMESSLQRKIKSGVVAGQLRRIAHIDAEIAVEPLEPDPDVPLAAGWRTRVRLGVDSAGAAGVRRLRSNDLVKDPNCAQPVPGLLAGVADRTWTPGAELYIATDGCGDRHITEVEPVKESGARGRTRSGDPAQRRRAAAARRAKQAHQRGMRVVEGSDRAVEFVRGRRFSVAAASFWQAHIHAPERYSAVVGELAALRPGQHAWDLYSGAGVFAAVLGDQVGPGGTVAAVEAAPAAVRDGAAALADIPQVTFHQGPTERVLDRVVTTSPDVVVLDPPRTGAGRGVIAKVAAASPQRIIHIGCDPAAFARDCALYAGAGYSLSVLRAFDAFPLTHHVECIGMFVK